MKILDREVRVGDAVTVRAMASYDHDGLPLAPEFLVVEDLGDDEVGVIEIGGVGEGEYIINTIRGSEMLLAGSRSGHPSLGLEYAMCSERMAFATIENGVVVEGPTPNMRAVYSGWDSLENYPGPPEEDGSSSIESDEEFAQDHFVGMVVAPVFVLDGKLKFVNFAVVSSDGHTINEYDDGHELTATSSECLVILSAMREWCRQQQ